MSASELRQKFLEFFKSKGHVIVASSSLIPDDPTVLLTTAGMQQFKNIIPARLTLYAISAQKIPHQFKNLFGLLILMRLEMIHILRSLRCSGIFHSEGILRKRRLSMLTNL